MKIEKLVCHCCGSLEGFVVDGKQYNIGQAVEWAKSRGKSATVIILSQLELHDRNEYIKDDT